MGTEQTDWAADDLLINLGQLAGGGHFTIAKERLNIGQGVLYPLRAFQEDQGVRERSNTGKKCLALTSFARQITEIEKGIGGQTGSGKRSQRRRGAGHGTDVVTRSQGSPNQFVPRIVDGRSSGIRYQGNIALSQRRKNRIQLGKLVVFVITG